MSETFRIPKGRIEATPLHDVLDDVCSEIVRQAAKHKVKVVVQMDRADRSEEQNAALFGVAYKALSAATGYRKEELHEVFCESYFGRVEYTLLGKTHSRPRRTTTTDELGNRDVISTLDFAEFYTHIQIVAADKLGVHVPDPDRNWRQNMERVA